MPAPAGGEVGLQEKPEMAAGHIAASAACSPRPSHVYVPVKGRLNGVAQKRTNMSQHWIEGESPLWFNNSVG